MGFSLTLVALVLFGYSRMEYRRNANSTAWQLSNAISAYSTEHRSYPTATTSGFDTDLSSDFQLMELLLSSDSNNGPTHVSPRWIPFFAGTEADFDSNGRKTGGLGKNDSGLRELWDPWGNHYRVRLDTNGDGKVADPSGREEFITRSIIVWSAGKDGDFETWNDNLRTW